MHVCYLLPRIVFSDSADNLLALLANKDYSTRLSKPAVDLLSSPDRIPDSEYFSRHFAVSEAFGNALLRNDEVALPMLEKLWQGKDGSFHALHNYIDRIASIYPATLGDQCPWIEGCTLLVLRHDSSRQARSGYLNCAAARRKLWSAWSRHQRSRHECQWAHERQIASFANGRRKCFHQRFLPVLQRLQEAAHQEVYSNVALAMQGRFPVELLEMAVEWALAAEELPTDWRVYKRTGAVQHVYECNLMRAVEAARNDVIRISEDMDSA